MWVYVQELCFVEFARKARDTSNQKSQGSVMSANLMTLEAVRLKLLDTLTVKLMLKENMSVSLKSLDIVTVRLKLLDIVTVNQLTLDTVFVTLLDIVSAKTQDTGLQQRMETDCGTQTEVDNGSVVEN